MNKRKKLKVRKNRLKEAIKKYLLYPLASIKMTNGGPPNPKNPSNKPAKKVEI